MVSKFRREDHALFENRSYAILPQVSRVVSQSFGQLKKALLLDTFIQQVPRTAQNQISSIGQTDPF